MELFVIIVSGFQPLTIITKCSILNVAAALDPPLFLWLSVVWLLLSCHDRKPIRLESHSSCFVICKLSSHFCDFEKNRSQIIRKSSQIRTLLLAIGDSWKFTPSLQITKQINYFVKFHVLFLLVLLWKWCMSLVSALSYRKKRQLS